jgi:hypothetical protein
MFYIGVAALTFQYDPGSERAQPPTSSASIRPGNLYTGGVCSCVIVVCVMLMFVLHDLRSWLLRTSTQLRQADKVIAVLSRKLRGASKNQSTPLELVQYARVYQSRDSTKTSSEKTTNTTQSPQSLTGTGAKYHSLYNDYDEEEAVDSETGSNANNSAHGVEGCAGQSTGGATNYERVICVEDEEQFLAGQQQQQQSSLREVLLQAVPRTAAEDGGKRNLYKEESYEAGPTANRSWPGSAKIVPTADPDV